MGGRVQEEASLPEAGRPFGGHASGLWPPKSWKAHLEAAQDREKSECSICFHPLETTVLLLLWIIFGVINCCSTIASRVFCWKIGTETLKKTQTPKTKCWCIFLQRLWFSRGHWVKWHQVLFLMKPSITFKFCAVSPINTEWFGGTLKLRILFLLIKFLSWKSLKIWLNFLIRLVYAIATK